VCVLCVVKVKVKRNAGRGGVELYLCSFLTSALDGDEWLTPHSGRFTPGKETRYPLYRRLDGLPGPVWKPEQLSS